MKLIALSKHINKEGKVLAITRDGWVVTESGAMGDVAIDCDVRLEGEQEFIENTRKRLRLTQQELAWVLGISRPTVIAICQGKRGLTLREYIMLKLVVDDVESIIKLNK